MAGLKSCDGGPTRPETLVQKQGTHGLTGTFCLFAYFSGEAHKTNHSKTASPSVMPTSSQSMRPVDARFHAYTSLKYLTMSHKFRRRP